MSLNFLTAFALQFLQTRWTKTFVWLVRSTELSDTEVIIFMIIKSAHRFCFILFLHIFRDFIKEVLSWFPKHLIKAKFVEPLFALIFFLEPMRLITIVWTVVSVVKSSWVVWLVELRAVLSVFLRPVWSFVLILVSLVWSLLKGNIVSLSMGWIVRACGRANFIGRWGNCW